MRGDQKRHIRRHQRQRDLDARIARPAPQAQAGPADADAVGDFADDNEGKGPGGRAEGEQAGGDRGDGKAVKDQGRGVVGETFALEHEDKPARQPERADDGERGNRVGRRHDGAEHEADGQGHAEEEVRDRRHRAGGEQDAAERQERDRAQVETEFAPAHRHAGGIDQRRQDAEQHQFRSQLDPRQAGNQRNADTGDDKKNGRRGVEPPRDDGDDHQHRQQKQDGLHRRRHGYTMPDIPERSSRLARRAAWHCVS